MYKRNTREPLRMDNLFRRVPVFFQKKIHGFLRIGQIKDGHGVVVVHTQS